MKKLIINGKFYTDSMQGIVRYARELTSALDRQLTGTESVILLVPRGAKVIPRFKNIRVVRYGRHKGIRWELSDLRRYVAARKDHICVNMCNIAPFGVQPGITVIHDIMYKVLPENYTSLRNRISRLWHCIQYRYVTGHELAVPTVSEFSRRDIEKVYPAAKSKLTVISDAYQHVYSYKESPDWQKKWSFLQKGEYFFSLATLSRNKNGKWIIETAKRNPDLTFAMAGKIYETEYDQIPENVHLLGFVSDEEACSLIKNCRAFIFPSLYEGFGLPPLEALALGAQVISSDTTSLPEVLGRCAHYIDPHDYNTDLEKLLSEPVADRSEALSRYSWDSSAKKLLELAERL